MRRHTLKFLVVIIVLAAASWIIYALVRPLPAIKPRYVKLVQEPQDAVALPWPGSGQAAIGAAGFGVLASSGSQQPIPMASVAKIVTALAVLKQKPLTAGQHGPIITFDNTDVSYYQSYLSQGGSVAKVNTGETISEYQALETMLLPSANNVAESLSRWAFGSPEAYITYANSFVKTLGLTQTSLADASGFSPQTTSTAKDLANLGLAAMANPALAQIVNQTQANVPVTGLLKNTNWLLGTDNFVGIKTGNTDQAGGCYLFATQQKISGQDVTIVGSVLGVPTLADAVNNGKVLADSAKTGFVDINPVASGQIVGTYRLPWGGSAVAVAQKDLSALIWKGSNIVPVATLDQIKPATKSGTRVGQVKLTSGQNTETSSVTLSSPVPKPSVIWRLFHL